MLSQPLETNSISVLTLTKLPALSNKPIRLFRRTPTPSEGFWTIQPSVLPNGPPERLPSTLPPPENIHLTISTEDMIGDGRCGRVFATSLLHLEESDSKSPNYIKNPGLPHLPSLVIKVADEARVDDLANEASMYDEMESLQGVVIPRCYGWFEAELEDDSMPAEDLGQATGSSSHEVRRRKLSVLLLERVGGHLPLGEPLRDRSDIWAIFSDISQLGIHQPDMRYSNIVFAPSSSFPALPPKLCPYHHRTHTYRIIDLDRARKTDWTLKQHYYQHVGTLGRLIEGMEVMGRVLEPWEY